MGTPDKTWPRPPCFDNREWDSWLEAARGANNLNLSSACSDCRVAFRKEMQWEGRCWKVTNEDVAWAGGLQRVWAAGVPSRNP